MRILSNRDRKEILSLLDAVGTDIGEIYNHLENRLCPMEVEARLIRAALSLEMAITKI